MKEYKKCSPEEATEVAAVVEVIISKANHPIQFAFFKDHPHEAVAYLQGAFQERIDDYEKECLAVIRFRERHHVC